MLTQALTTVSGSLPTPTPPVPGLPALASLSGNNIRNLQLLMVLDVWQDKPRGVALSIEFSPVADVLVASYGEVYNAWRNLCFWQVAEAQCISREVPFPVHHMAYNADGTLLALGGVNGQVGVFRPSDAHYHSLVLTDIPGFSEPTLVSFLPNSQVLLFAIGLDVLQTINPATSLSKAAAFLPKLWDVETLEMRSLPLLEPPSRGVFAVAVSAPHRLIAYNDARGTHLVDIDTAAERSLISYAYNFSGQHLHHIAFSPDGTYIATS
jgi:WD40 repeat protein